MGAHVLDLMKLENWNTRFFKQFFQSTNKTTSVDAHKHNCSLYQITSICEDKEANYVEHLIRERLSAVDHAIELFKRDSDSSGKFTRFHLHLRCTPAERAHLVQMVSRLGIEQAVRSVRWQGIPERCKAD